MKLPAASGGTFEKCPAGNHLGVCYEVIDLGTQPSEEYGPKHQIWIGWETPNETMEDGRPFVIGKFYNYSMNEKASLRLHLESWRGKPFTDNDIGPNGTFEIQNLIGAACFLNVVHSEKNGNIKAKIEAVAPLPKGVEAVKPVNQPIFVCLNKEEFKQAAFDSISERMQAMVAASPEYKALRNGKPVVPSGDSGSDEGDETPF